MLHKQTFQNCAEQESVVQAIQYRLYSRKRWYSIPQNFAAANVGRKIVPRQITRVFFGRFHKLSLTDRSKAGGCKALIRRSANTILWKRQKVSERIVGFSFVCEFVNERIFFAFPSLFVFFENSSRGGYGVLQHQGGASVMQAYFSTENST